MTNVLVVYTTSLGNTGKLAESVRNGTQSVEEVEVVLREAEQATKDDAWQADGILVGSPVRHRSADHRVKTLSRKCSSSYG